MVRPPSDAARGSARARWLAVALLFVVDLHYDRRLCEWAASDLILDAASRGAEAFAARFAELRARCHDLDLPRFPSIHPQQEAIARAARDLEVAEVLAAVAPMIEARTMKRALRREVADGEAWLAARPTEVAS